MLHRPQKKYGSYSYYEDLKLYDDFKLKDEDLKSTNDLEFAFKFCKDQDAVILAYLLEYYSENSMTHIVNYMDLLLYKPCFGEMKYNFPIKRFKEVSVCQDKNKVYIPLTQLIPPDKISEYRLIRNNILPDIYIVPLPNFTTYNPKTKEKNLDDKDFSPFLQIVKNENELFNIPSMEAAINSRWDQAMKYWVGPLSLYIVFLIIGFSALSHVYLSDDLYYIINYSVIILLYYNGAYLFIIESMQLIKYKSKYFTFINAIDVYSIVLGMIVFTLILLVNVFVAVEVISNKAIVILTAVTTLMLWIESLL
ncbi:hypothetical protein GLOIN_2v1881093 [Rhizophagus clarus]|uniref:Ion transport domain-containing protein n=1 Tax=Rhizophagus clarus TaxID=94130 RepID=A0A8H3QT08_9GLOM|nr:hypothetical protein GLOIN_2v1881093 [Rhizophagus clarus]